MVDLVGRQARIVLAADPQLWIGADNCDNCAIKPVITDGQMKTWSGKDGCLVLDDTWYCGYEGDNVVVRLNPTDCTKWYILMVAPNVYQIRVPGTEKAWTVATDPKAPVTLTSAGSVEPKFQEFRLIVEE